MSKPLASLVACALLVGTGVFWLNRPPDPSPVASAPVSRGMSESRSDPADRGGGDVAALDGELAPRLEPAGGVATWAESEGSAETRSPAPAPAPGPAATRPRVPSPARVGGELGRRARIIEARADRELERLVPVLGLTESQQDRIFEIVARSSPLYGGGMAVVAGDPGQDSTAGAVPAQESDGGPSAGGAPASSGEPAPRPVEELIHEVLDPEQQIAYEQVVLDDLEWWEDWLVKQERYLDGAAGELVDVSAALLADDGGQASAVPPPGTDPDNTSEKTVTRPVALPSQ